MRMRMYGLGGLRILCLAGVFLAQNPRPDNLPPPGLATPTSVRLSRSLRTSNQGSSWFCSHSLRREFTGRALDAVLT